jgi:1,4-dihydroxy-2-naphthoate octaprenyltransferase
MRKNVQPVFAAAKKPLRHHIRNWALLTRANFLVLTVVVVAAGVTGALYYRQSFDSITCAMTLAGALLTHVSVNVLNNYFDYKSGLDAETWKTPFSGGVDVLVRGEISPLWAYISGLVAMGGAALVGLLFLFRHFLILWPIIACGAVSIYFYTPYLSRLPAASEIVAGINFGLMALGTYVVQSGHIDNTALATSSVVAILVGLLLFLNEFPDADIDKKSGRRHLVILLGRRKASTAYGVLLTVTYLLILISVVMGALPLTCLVALMTVPMALKASRTVRAHYGDPAGLVPALGMNVLIVLVTIGLLSVGFLTAGLLAQSQLYR